MGICRVHQIFHKYRHDIRRHYEVRAKKILALSEEKKILGDFPCDPGVMEYIEHVASIENVQTHVVCERLAEQIRLSLA